MKRLLSFALYLVMLCSCFVLSANMADDANAGIKFADNSIYRVEEALDKVPQTIEAVVYFNKRLPGGTKGGAVFGNYRGHAGNPDMTLTIEAGGIPMLRARDGINEQTYKFTEGGVFKSAWVHLTVVLDQSKNEARCYIDGELVGTIASKVDFAKIGTWDMVVGGDMTSLNRNPFTGRMKSLTVYSDVRTEKEIKEDMTKVDTSVLLLHYDFSALTEEIPEVLTDLSKNKNDAIHNKIWFEEKEPVTDYAYSFAIVGDTQRMAVNYPDYFDDIYEYIYDNINDKNIEMVIGMGDITDSFDKENTAAEWDLALDAFEIIDDYVPHIPIRGNHDNRFYYNKTMSKINYAEIVDGFYQENDYRNTYTDMEIGGIPYLFLNIDYAMTTAELEWANQVCQQFPNHNIIVLRHAYMNHDYTPLSEGDPLDPSYDFGDAGYLSGDATWDGLVRKYENIVLVLSGHVSSDFVVVNQRKGDKGNTVTEMLIDFQGVDDTVKETGVSENGLGIVNFFYFSEDGKTLTIDTYSPVVDKYFYDSNQFTIELDMYTNSKYVKPEKEPVPERTETMSTEIKMTLDSLTAYVNGEAKTLDAAPVIKNSRTMLPVRFVAENLGATVGWDDATKTVTVTSDTVSIEIVIGSAFAKVNGQTIVLDSPAYIEPSNSRTYLPVRVVAENLGAEVSWDDATKTATLVK